MAVARGAGPARQPVGGERGCGLCGSTAGPPRWNGPQERGRELGSGLARGRKEATPEGSWAYGEGKAERAKNPRRERGVKKSFFLFFF